MASAYQLGRANSTRDTGTIGDELLQKQRQTKHISLSQYFTQHFWLCLYSECNLFSYDDIFILHYLLYVMKHVKCAECTVL